MRKCFTAIAKILQGHRLPKQHIVHYRLKSGSFGRSKGSEIQIQTRPSSRKCCPFSAQIYPNIFYPSITYKTPYLIYGQPQTLHYSPSSETMGSSTFCRVSDITPPQINTITLGRALLYVILVNSFHFKPVNASSISTFMRSNIKDHNIISTKVKLPCDVFPHPTTVQISPAPTS